MGILTLFEEDKTTENDKITLKNFDNIESDDYTRQKASATFNKNIKEETIYFLKATATQTNMLTGASEATGKTTPLFLPIETRSKDETVLIAQGEQKSSSSHDYMPSCGVLGVGGTLGGCIAQGIYYLFFLPSSYLFALSGVFFDNTFAYSVNDSSYGSAFVVQGWGLVRDFCNMFFIFVLLYISFKTILRIGGSGKTKEMVINVIIIGLLINFSLFATQLIIDTSNILARVFYNSNTIKITQSDAGTASNQIAKADINGVIPLSAAIVNKINPQNLIMNADKVDAGDPAGQSSNTNKNGVTTGTFILVTLLSIFMNVTGIFVFLSTGIIFISRVIGLWIAMIISPLAFFSYTIPAMRKIEMIGWNRWLSETLKLAFLAPIFIFFLYLILKFLEKGLGVIAASNTDSSLAFVIAIIIPFVFMMVLLLKAKDIANNLSGKIGQSITGAISAVGGAAIGGAALGTAALGRGLVSNPMKMMTSSQKTRDAAIKNAKLYKPNTWGKYMSAKMAQKTINKDTGTNKLRDKLLSLKKDEGDKKHSTKLLDEHADKIETGKKFSDLNQNEQEKAKENLHKEELSKFMFNKKPDQLDKFQNNTLTNALNSNKENLSTLLKSLGKDPTKFNDADHHETIYNKPDTGLRDKARVALTTGSYDVRNTKLTGLLKPVELAMKLGFHSLGVGVQKGQGDFTKDLGRTIRDALKGVKINVKVDQDHKKGVVKKDKKEIEP